MSELTKTGGLGLLILWLASAGASSANDDKDWFVELEAMPGYHDNYFFRGEGAARAPDTTLFSLYALGEKERKTDRGKFTFDFDVGYVFVQDINDADYYDINLGGKYKWKSSRISAEAFARPKQVFEEEGTPVFFDLTGLEVGYRHNLRPGLWVGFEYEYESQDFDRLADLRDADKNTFALSLRYPMSARYGLRGTLFYEAKDAESGEFSNQGPGAALALEGQPSDRVQLFLRYKYRERDFEDAPPDDRNFEREDELQDIVFNITWFFTPHWGWRLENFFRDGSSTRPDRNYDGNRIYTGLVYGF